MIVIIDKIEGDIVSVELSDNSIINVPKSLFEDVKEGMAYEILPTSNPISERIEKLMDEVFDD